MKKIVALLLMSVMMLALTGCGVTKRMKRLQVLTKRLF